MKNTPTKPSSSNKSVARKAAIEENKLLIGYTHILQINIKPFNY